MAPRILSSSAARRIAFRCEAIDCNKQFTVRSRWPSARRFINDEKPLPKADTPAPGPNQQQLPHVSEEAATMGKITGQSAPDLKEGIPIQEVLERDEGAKEKAPEVLKPNVASSATKGTKAHSFAAVRPQESALMPVPGQSMDGEGHKFGLPALPLPERAHIKHREEPIVHQVTQLLIEDGKKSVAQQIVARILNCLRTTRPPVISSTIPMMPNIPPASHLPLDPVSYMTLAIDSVAPLLKLKSYRGLAGGGQSLQIPIPLAIKQRRRVAFKWILDSARKKTFKGSGKGGFAQKVADELVSVLEGRSAIWDRRGTLHKVAVTARANLTKVGGSRR